MGPMGMLSIAGPTLGGLFSKDAPDQKLGQAFLTNPLGNIYAQQQLRNTMAGAGDFGFGNIAKQGMGTLGQMFAGRGINPLSGVAMGATADMLGGAMAQDAASRRNYALNLMTHSPGTVTAANRAGPGWASNDFGNLGRMYEQTQGGWGSTAENPHEDAWEYKPHGSDLANWMRARSANRR